MNDMNETVNTFRTNSIEVLEKKVKKPQKNKANKGNYLIRYLIFFNFMFLGFVNHLGYYLILTSSQQFATKLGNESLIACYPLALIIFSSLTRLINSKYCLNISYYIRIIILSVQFFIGYISFFCILAYNKILRNKNKAFWLSMIPTTLVGISESFGEVTVLGYVGTFKGNYISGWNIGSALAGVCGTFLSLLFKKLNTNLKYVYLFLSPIAVLYLFVFMLTNLCGAKEKKIITKKNILKFMNKK